MIASQPRSTLRMTSSNAAGGVAIGRRQEFIVEAEAVEEMPQHRIVVVREALVLAERVGDLGQRLAEILGRAAPGSGTLSGTLRSPSMSSLNAISRVGAPPVSSS